MFLFTLFTILAVQFLTTFSVVLHLKPTIDLAVETHILDVKQAVLLITILIFGSLVATISFFLAACWMIGSLA